MCLVFVFAALLEYALVNVLARRRGIHILHSIPQLALPGLQLQAAATLALPPQPEPESLEESQLDQVGIIAGGGARSSSSPIIGRAISVKYHTKSGGNYILRES